MNHRKPTVSIAREGREMNFSDSLTLLRSELQAHVAVAEKTADALDVPFSSLVALTLEALRNDKKLILFGNGGSAADAQHWATELTVRYRESRPAIAALALTTDTSALTAIGNDLGFDQIFSRQIEALARPGDVAIGISTSGRSPNIIAAFEKARSIGCKTIVFTGNDGGKSAQIADIALIVPSNDTSRIQEIHAVLGHAMCSAIEAGLRDDNCGQDL